MPESDEEIEFIHVRTTPQLKRKINVASSAADQNLSEFVRETLGNRANEILENTTIDELQNDDQAEA